MKKLIREWFIRNRKTRWMRMLDIFHDWARSYRTQHWLDSGKNVALVMVRKNLFCVRLLKWKMWPFFTPFVLHLTSSHILRSLPLVTHHIHMSGWHSFTVHSTRLTPHSLSLSLLVVAPWIIHWNEAWRGCNWWPTSCQCLFFFLIFSLSC